MSTFAKILLGLCVICSWGAAFLTAGLFAGNPFGYLFLLLLFLVFLLLLTPFALFLYLFPKDDWVFGAFFLGMAGFVVLAPSFVTGVGILISFLGFFYWRVNIASALEAGLAPSSSFILEGMGLFLSSLALFGALLFLASPQGNSKEALIPAIPKSFFDAVYEPTSSFVLTRLMGGAQDASLPEENINAVKEALYQTLNTMLQKTAASYQRYIPFVFAAGVFFSLKGFFIFFKYGIQIMIFLLVHLFLRLGLLVKEFVEVKKQVIRPAF